MVLRERARAAARRVLPSSPVCFAPLCRMCYRIEGGEQGWRGEARGCTEGRAGLVGLGGGLGLAAGAVHGWAAMGRGGGLESKVRQCGRFIRQGKARHSQAGSWAEVGTAASERQPADPAHLQLAGPVPSPEVLAGRMQPTGSE